MKFQLLLDEGAGVSLPGSGPESVHSALTDDWLSGRWLVSSPQRPQRAAQGIAAQQRSWNDGKVHSSFRNQCFSQKLEKENLFVGSKENAASTGQTGSTGNQCLNYGSNNNDDIIICIDQLVYQPRPDESMLKVIHCDL